MATQIQLRRDNSINWQSVNPILAEGEFGVELDTTSFKVGDGISAWNDLPYFYDYISTTVASNSGNWNIAYDISTSYQKISSSLVTNSTVNSISSQLVLNTDFNDYKTSLNATTATLLPTSIYQDASGNWQDTYTIVQVNSALWEETVEISAVTTTVESNSGNWQDTYTIVQADSAQWNQAYNVATTYQDASGSFATNTLLENTSALLTPLALTNTLTGELLDYIKLLAPPPTYISPTVSISNFSPSNVEIGETINQTLTLNWTQNDAGSSGIWRLNKNGTEVISSSASFPANYAVNETAVLSTITYQLSVNFDTGLIKNNSLGFPDNRGQILSGSVTNSSSYTGYYRRWIGSNATFPVTPASIRTLGLTTTLDTNNTLASQASPIYINNKFILIAIPNTKTLTTVITEANENLTSQFSLSSIIQIPDAGSTLRDYKLYYLETAVPLNANLTTVNIS